MCTGKDQEKRKEPNYREGSRDKERIQLKGSIKRQGKNPVKGKDQETRKESSYREGSRDKERTQLLTGKDQEKGKNSVTGKDQETRKESIEKVKIRR